MSQRLEALLLRQKEANRRKALRKVNARRKRNRNYARNKAKAQRKTQRLAAAQQKAQRTAERTAQRAFKQAAKDARAAARNQPPKYVQSFIIAFNEGRRVGFEEGKLFAQQQHRDTQAPALIKLN